MRSKLILSGVMAASLVGMPAIAFAQAETATNPPAAKSEAKPEAKPEAKAEAKTPAKHQAKAVHFHSGTTTGMSTRSMSTRSDSRARPGGEPISRKPAAN